MSNREISWLQAATLILQDSTKVWMTAPEIVRETTKRDMKTINYSQSVRTLRQSLSTSSQKAESPFVKREIKGSILFGLRQRCELPAPSLDGTHSKVGRPRKPKKKRQEQNQQKKKNLDVEKTPYPIANGLGEDVLCSPKYSPSSMIKYSAPPPSISQSRYMALHRVPEPTTVEIDPEVKHQSSSPGSPMVCLPSPRASILAVQKVLQNLPGSEEHCVWRKSRKRPAKEDLSESPLSPLMNGFTHDAFFPSSYPATPDVVSMETCHTLSSPDYEVDCVRPLPSEHQLKSSHDEDPCMAQGDRSHCASFELGPKPPRKKKKPMEVVKYDVEPLSSTTQPSSSSSSTSESDLESDYSDLHIQSRPSSQLLVRRLSQQKQQASGDKLSMDSMSDLNEDEEGMDTSDVDQDYLASRTSNNLRRSREVMKRRMKMRRRAAAGMARSGKAEGQGSHVWAAEGAGKEVNCLKRNISLLFQPQSPLINENLKSFLKMDTFSTLSVGQKAKLTKLLPAVDRTGPTSIAKTSLNNSFFGSAVREWVDLVALGGFTPEHRAKLRADEKKKNAVGKQEETWKSRFFEDNWGDKQGSEVDSEVDSGAMGTPFFPRPKPSSNILQTYLSTILRSYCKGELETPPQSPPPPAPIPPSQTTPNSSAMPAEPSVRDTTTLPTASSPSPKVLSSPHPLTQSSLLVSSSRSPLTESKNITRHPIRTKGLSSTPPKPSPRSSALTPPHMKQKPQSPKITKKVAKPPPKLPMAMKKNHVAKRVLNKVSVQSLPLRPEENSPKRSGKVLAMASSGRPSGTSANMHSSSRVIEQLKLGISSGKTVSISKDELSSQFLSHLPPRTPYQTLLIALTKACKPNKAVLYSRGISHSLNSHPFTKQNSLSSPNSSSQVAPHTHSVYLDHFSTLAEAHVPLEFSYPVVSLPIHFPIKVYESYQCGKQIQEEHSYIHRTKGSAGKMKKRMHFKLSVPRSILKKNDCMCEKGPLVFCSRCRSLYHSLCNTRTLCQSCFAIMGHITSK